MSWFEGFHPDQSNWPYERIRGWGPGDYTCTCQDCGCHYMGAKRSVQCYPCAEKFTPPPRSETPQEIRADRDRLASELAQVRGELARTKRNHLRRMAHQSMEARRRSHDYAIQRGARWPDDRIRAINTRFNRFFDAVWKTLAALEGGAK